MIYHARIRRGYDAEDFGFVENEVIWVILGHYGGKKGKFKKLHSKSYLPETVVSHDGTVLLSKENIIRETVREYLKMNARDNAIESLLGEHEVLVSPTGEVTLRES